MSGPARRRLTVGGVLFVIAVLLLGSSLSSNLRPSASSGTSEVLSPTSPHSAALSSPLVASRGEAAISKPMPAWEGGIQSMTLLRRAKAFGCIPGRTPKQRKQFKPESLGPLFTAGLAEHLTRFPRSSVNMTRGAIRRMKRLPLPPRVMLAPYTFNNSIDLSKELMLETEAKEVRFEKDFMEFMQEIVANRSFITYPDSRVIYKLADDHPHIFRGRSVFIPGSEKPCFEIWLREYAKTSHITTLEYRPFGFDYPDTTVFGVFAYWALPPEKRPTYDTFFSYSNWEHDGLGRYGDPYNPNGDLDAIKESWSMLKHDSVRVVSSEQQNERERKQNVPAVQYSESHGVVALPARREEAVCWNIHRLYSTRRLLQMFVGYQVIAIYDSFPLASSHMNYCNEVFHVKVVLRKICGPPDGLLDVLFTSFRKALVKSEGSAESLAIEKFDEVAKKYKDGTW